MDNDPVIPPGDTLSHYIEDHHKRDKLGLLKNIFFNVAVSKLGDNLTAAIHNALDVDSEMIDDMAEQIGDLLKDKEFSHWTSALEYVYDEAKDEIVEKVASSIDMSVKLKM